MSTPSVVSTRRTMSTACGASVVAFFLLCVSVGTEAQSSTPAPAPGKLKCFFFVSGAVADVLLFCSAIAGQVRRLSHDRGEIDFHSHKQRSLSKFTVMNPLFDELCS